METEMISLAEAQRLNPLIDTSHFIGALWRADGGIATVWHHAGVRQGARALGASVERFTAYGRWRSVPTIPGMSSRQGHGHAEHVVNCAGLWAREVAVVGIELPVLAMETTT